MIQCSPRRGHLRCSAAALLTSLAAPAPAPAQPQPAPAAPAATSLTVEQWRTDLDFLAENLPAKHLNPFFKTSRERFDSAVRDLRDKLPELDTPGITLGLIRLAAMLGDAHTSVNAAAVTQGFARYPIALLPLKDGLAVFAAPPDHPEMAGWALVSIDGTPVAEVIDRVSTLYAWENRATRLGWLRNWINAAEALHHLGVTKSATSATFAFRTPQGEPKEVELAASPPASLKVKTIDITPIGVAAVSRKPDARALWFEMLPDTKVLYIRYERCTDDKARTISAYSADLTKRLDEGGIDRLIFDLRNNGGGNSALFDPFILLLSGRKEFASPGGVVVLIGRNTFSSAQLNASTLRKMCKAVLIGGPTGQKPNAYGEVKTFTLPNSGFEVRYSTKHFQTDPADPESMMPDVRVQPTIADYLSGRDIVLEAAVAYTAK